MGVSYLSKVVVACPVHQAVHHGLRALGADSVLTLEQDSTDTATSSNMSMSLHVQSHSPLHCTRISPSLADYLSSLPQGVSCVIHTMLLHVLQASLLLYVLQGPLLQS